MSRKMIAPSDVQQQAGGPSRKPVVAILSKKKGWQRARTVHAERRITGESLAVKLEFASLEMMFGEHGSKNSVTLLQPFVHCRGKLCWLQWFLGIPTRNVLGSCMMWGKPLSGQNVKEHNLSLYTLQIGRIYVPLPHMVGLKTGLDNNWIDGDGVNDLICYWERIGPGVRIGLHAGSRKAAREFLKNEDEWIKHAARLPWEK